MDWPVGRLVIALAFGIQIPDWSNLPHDNQRAVALCKAAYLIRNERVVYCGKYLFIACFGMKQRVNNED